MTEEDAVKLTIQDLLDNLYIPCEDERAKSGIDFVADPVKVDRWNLDDDAINWGDLTCVEVVATKDGQFQAVIEEAAPGCHNLIRYVEHFMSQWGWDVRVQTEW